MRRLLPWGLVLLIGVGAGLGAALGQVNATNGTDVAAPAQWMASVLAATKAAGTAHLHLTEVTASPNPDLRGSGSGSGVADFATGSIHVSEVDHEFQWSAEDGGPMQRSAVINRDDEIVIGRTVYFDDPAVPDSWMSLPGGKSPGDLGLASAGGFGLVLSALTGSVNVIVVHDLGPATIDGQPATRYLVQSEPTSSCPSLRPPVGTTMVWVDESGRMVQARYSFFFSGKFPKSFPHPPAGLHVPPEGPMTFTETLRLTAFGEPVLIKAPNLDNSLEKTLGTVGVSASASTVARCP